MKNTSVSFRFRASKLNPTKGTVYMRVTRNGVRSGDFSTGISTTKKKWEKREVKKLGERLEKIRADALKIASQHPTAMANMIRKLYEAANNETPMLEQVAKMFVEDYTQKRNLAPRTITSYYTRLRLLAKKRGSTALDDITHDWAEEYVAELLGEGYDPDYAYKQIQFTHQILKWSASKGLLKHNKLAYFHYKFKRPVITYLTTEEKELMERVNMASEPLERAKKVFLFQCETGLDHSDVKKFFVEKDLTIRDGKLCIGGLRSKTGHPYFVPLTDKAIAIMNSFGKENPVTALQPYNRNLKQIANILGINKRLTTHVARKTAAIHWLNIDLYSIETVSLMMGHINTKTTWKWYAKVLPERVLRERQEILEGRR